MTEHVIALRDITKVYVTGEVEVRAVGGVSLTLIAASSWPSWARAARANPP
jgi:hypothetical protein